MKPQVLLLVAMIALFTTMRSCDHQPRTPAYFDIPPLMAASVRITSQLEDNCYFGSGSIIECDDGRVTVLTCGHLLRGKLHGIVDVEVFNGLGTQTYAGFVEDYDTEKEVGIVHIWTDDILPTVPIAPGPPAVGEELLTIGCPNGDDPTPMRVEVLSLDAFEGEGTVECTKTPEHGRSGGGLFNAHGQLVGLCFGIDIDTGIYAGLEPINEALEW